MPTSHGLRPLLKPRQHAGASSGLLARFLAFPADTIKARMQVHGALAQPARGGTNVLQAVTNLYRAEGLGGFYRGFGAVVLGAVPAQATYFAAYEFGKTASRDTLGLRGMPASMATGCIAQAIAGVVFTPMDILKERLQV